jgi:phosphonopyruvate decarboxylase
VDVMSLISQFKKNNIDFYTGVPDSQLKPLCNYLMDKYGISNDHIIAANEGNAVALAAGYFLATGKVPCVYLQNSGMGNIINPVASLLSDQVYGIPCVFIVGWRGEPDHVDEPQHRFQGEVTLRLLEVMNIEYRILDQDTTENDLEHWMNEFMSLLDAGKSVALVVKRGSLHYEQEADFKNDYSALSEEIIQHITQASKEDVIVSTTGKISRELFETRESGGQSHQFDFLTVGSMGHCSSIALGVAIHQPIRRVWCIDGDGAALMHMGSMALIGAQSPSNFIHIIINNGAHESVGGHPTVADSINFKQVALACGYKGAYSVNNLNELDEVLAHGMDEQGPTFIEVKSAIGSRKDLGRPAKSPRENKISFMEYLNP